MCQRPLTLPPSCGSLADNQLCGLDAEGDGTYTAEGITKLCEGLKGSAVTSLRCAATRRVFAFVSAPVDTLALPPFPFRPSLAAFDGIRSERRAPPRLPPSSRRRRSPTWSAPPPEHSLLCQCPLTHSSFPWQFDRKRPLRPRLAKPWHLHCGGHHQAVQGAQGKRHNLAQVRRSPQYLLSCQRPLTYA